MTVNPWHHLGEARILELLDTRLDAGIDPLEAQARLLKYGPNALSQKQGKSRLTIFLEQFNQPLVYILMAAGVLTGLLREWIDMSVIFAVVLLNAIVGFVQEAKATQAMEALSRTMQSEATVLRGGEKQRISARDLVLGDVVLLQSGDKVPADLRLVRVRDLQIDESALTGESVPVEKNNAPELADNTVLAERSNIAHTSTLVTYGAGTGVVVAVGDRTEIGQINSMIASVQSLETPLTGQIERFSLALMKIILGISVLTLMAGLLRSEVVDREVLKESFIEVVALAVGAVPEGLPVVVTMTLAIGVSRMAKRNAIIRKLAAVETLGSTTVICTDKTGTLTQNEMTVQEVEAGGEHLSVSGIGYGVEGHFSRDGVLAPVSTDVNQAMVECLKAGVLCNDSRLAKTDLGYRVEGDPTEASLIVAAAKAGLGKTELEQLHPRVDSIPFESQYMYMATLHDAGGDERLAYIKGSVEQLLHRCGESLDSSGAIQPLDRQAVERSVETMTHHGLRVLAFASKSFPANQPGLTHDDINSGLTFLGLQAMIDPARPEVVDAVASCQKAGIRVKMITGDHIGTAAAIGEKIGLGSTSIRPQVMNGQELASLSDRDLQEAADRVSVFARVAPEQKLRLVKALQSLGHVVAMTGDGVNDAPALRQADIGAAMGITGTEVAKEAADMVLLDDNFATIRVAVEEGRRIYDNIIKSIIWLLPTNASLGFIIVVSSFFNLGMPVTPLHILWINTVAAVLLGTTLAFEVAEPGIMDRPPRPPETPLLERPVVWRILIVGAVIAAIAFFIYELERSDPANSLAVAQTAAVNAVVFAQIFLLFNLRSRRYTAFRMGFFSNHWLLLGVSLMVLAQLLFTYTPLMHHVFRTAAIGGKEWMIILGASLALYLIIELRKGALRGRKGRGRPVITPT